MMDQRAYELSLCYIAERLAAAEEAHLLRAVAPRRSRLPACAAWAGGVLVRAGRRLQAIGGAQTIAPSLGMQRGAM